MEYLDPFIQSTEKIFEQLLNLRIKAQIAEISSHTHSYHGISGIIHFTDGIKGSLIVNFPEETAKQVVQRLLPDSTESLDNALLIDGIGEVTNLICGNSKAGMKELGWQIQISLPHVVVGKNYLIQRPKGVTSFVSTFKSEIGSFLVELMLKLDQKLLETAK